MKTKYLIIGGGLSGLIMGMELTKRGEDYIIVEKSGKPVEAKLHYLHADLSNYFPFKLREVDIVTNWMDTVGHIRADAPSVEDMNHFSYVTTGTIFQNSMKFLMTKNIGKGWVPEEGIENISNIVAQYNKNKPMIGCELIGIMRDDNKKIASIKRKEGELEEIFEVEYEKIVSTIPLPFLLQILGIETSYKFNTEPLKMTEVYLDKKYYDDLFQIIYLPYATFGYSRISILGKRIVLEKANGDFESKDNGRINEIAINSLLKRLLPNIDTKDARYEDMINWYGRYVPIEEHNRMEIVKRLESMDIILLGRYAEWTYRRTDHVVKIAEKIVEDNYIKKGDN